MAAISRKNNAVPWIYDLNKNIFQINCLLRLNDELVPSNVTAILVFNERAAVTYFENCCHEYMLHPLVDRVIRRAYKN